MTSDLKKSRPGFTIVELLVVIAIIGILIGMLIPAVNAAREAGRRIQCAKNIKELGLAMQNYESKFGYLPLNWGCGNPNEGDKGGADVVQGDSWISAILPDLGETNIWNLIKFGEKLSYTDIATSHNNKKAAEQGIDVLTCPSDPDSRNGVFYPNNANFRSVMLPDDPSDSNFAGVGCTNYKACIGSNWKYVVDNNQNLVLSTPDEMPQKGRNNGNPALNPDYLNSVDGLDRGNGITCRNFIITFLSDGVTPDKTKILHTTMSDIQQHDGTSHTFAIGEALPMYCNYNAWYWYDGAIATCGVPLNYKYPGAVRPPDPTAAYAVPYQFFTFGFMSLHPGGANFCMCDGSATFVKDDIDAGVYSAGSTPAFTPGTYQAYATIDAGEVIKNE